MVIKKKIDIFYIICPNGLGHLKRSLFIISELLKKNKNYYFTILFCRSDNRLVNEILNKYLKKRVKFLYFKNVQTNFIQNLKKELSKKNFLKVFKKSNYVVSDNFAHPLLYRRDTILVGSFLWSDILIPTKKNLRFIKEEKELIKKFNPKLICLKQMIYDKINKDLQLKKFNWMRKQKDSIILKKKITKKDDLFNILISPSKFYDKELILKIISHISKEKNLNLYLPKSLKYLTKKNCKFKIFNFKDSEFNKIDLNICRAGVGAIEDSVEFKMPIIALPEKINLEIKSNILNITRNKLGYQIDLKNFFKTSSFVYFKKKRNFLNKLKLNLIKKKIDGL